MASSFTRFLDHTQRHTRVGRTPLDEWSARRRNLHLTTHNTHNRLISMPSVGFEPTFSTVERQQTYALHRAATRTGQRVFINYWKFNYSSMFKINKHTFINHSFSISIVKYIHNVYFFLIIIELSINVYKEATWCNLAVCLLVTAIIPYMFRTLFASILRSTEKL